MKESLPFFGNHVNQVNEPAGIPPLVIVPGEDLDHVAFNIREKRVENCRMRVPDDVA